MYQSQFSVSQEQRVIARAVLLALCGPQPHIQLNILKENGSLEKAFPEIAAMWGPKGQLDRSEFTENTAWQHSMKRLEQVSTQRDLNLNLAAIFGDIGKPLTFRREANGSVSNAGYSAVSANLFQETIAPRLGLSHNIVDIVSKTILYLNDAAQARDSSKVTFKTLRDLTLLPETIFKCLLELHKADTNVKNTLECTANISNYDYLIELRERLSGSKQVLPSEVPAVLFVVTAQNDFLKLLEEDESPPNLVHIGNAEARRLVGEAGSLIEFLKNAHLIPPEKLTIIHLVDEHEPIRDAKHFSQFGSHAIKNTYGARLFGEIDELARNRPNTHFVSTAGLRDWDNPELQTILRDIMGGRNFDEVRFGVVGVWTDAKVSMLINDLRQTADAGQVATSSSLTASNSVGSHHHELEKLRTIQSISVYDSPGEFLKWLVPSEEIQVHLTAQHTSLMFTPSIEYPMSWSEKARRERDQLLQKAAAGNLQLILTPLTGGYSPSQVFIATGDDQQPFVIKIAPRSELARERAGYDRIRDQLKQYSPNLIYYFEANELAIMSIDLVGLNDCKLNTLQKLIQSDSSSHTTELAAIALHTLFKPAMGRFYGASTLVTRDLLNLYGFTDRKLQPQHVRSILEKSRKIADLHGYTDETQALSAFGGNSAYMSPGEFYQHWLPGKSAITSVPISLVHGDLNAMNNLLAIDDNGQLRHMWIIDFARLDHLPVLTDLAKFENDLSFIMQSIETNADFKRALKIQSARLSSNTLELEDLLPEATSQSEAHYIRLLIELRKIAASIDPRGRLAMRDYTFALLRYSAHTLGFDEPNNWQLLLALHSTAQLCGRIATYVDNDNHPHNTH